MNGSEAEDNGEDIEHSASKGAEDDSPNGASAAHEETVRRKAPAMRKYTGPKLPQLQPAIHSASTSAGTFRAILMSAGSRSSIIMRLDSGLCLRMPRADTSMCEEP